MTNLSIRQIIQAIEEFAPTALQENYDNCGLQIGDPEAMTSGVLLSIDVTEEVVEEAINKNINLIIAHHPLLFKGVKSITGSTCVERIIIKAIQHQVAIYASHTCMDNVREGVNQKIAQKIGLEDTTVLDPVSDKLLKLRVYVPIDYASEIRTALFSAGIGHIGKYDHCSFNAEGEGSFKAGETCSPFRGKIGQLHYEKETCIETVLPAYLKTKAIQLLQKVHPYEEPAFDIISLQNQWEGAGSGLIGKLPSAMDERSFLQHIKETFHLSTLKHYPLHNRPIKTVALCGGAGAFLIKQAVNKGADIFLTGEIKYHDYLDYQSQIVLSEIGHYESEQYTKEIFYDIITKKFPTFATYYSMVETNPINYL